MVLQQNLPRPPSKAPQRSLELSIIVPTYNEAGNLASLIRKLSQVLSGISWEVIFADDNSPDGTHRLAKEIALADPRVRCLRRVGRRGLAGACIDGILSSSAPYVAVMDGDLQHDEAILLRMLHTLEDSDMDIVVGTRYREGGSAIGLAGHRGAISRFATALTGWLLPVPVSDPMSGFFMVRRDRFEEVAPQLSHDGFKILLDLLATARNLRISEEPYLFRAREQGESKFDLRASLEFLGLLAAKTTGDVIEPRFVPYAFVGALGMVVHFVVLKSALQGAGLSFEVSQSVATLFAMIANFFVNNVLTYKDLRIRGWRILKGLAIFCTIGAAGFVANIGVAHWLYGDNHVWWMAGAAGALIGAVWNYAMSSRLVWHLR
ncbi:MAG: glycosyltransferase family 2 protein [Proteobacteria bacterium]|nr:glycosyltransferase family 2 protein [Pseudomonadota bacterium]